MSVFPPFIAEPLHKIRSQREIQKHRVKVIVGRMKEERDEVRGMGCEV